MSESGKEKRDPITNAVVLDHNYDGIEELDNPLPKWWLLTFYGAIAFSFVYVGYYWVGTGPSQREIMNADLKAIEIQQLANAANEKLDPEILTAALSDSAALAVGKTVFGEKCAACHMADGGGSIGPNLADNYFIHGNQPEQVLNVIREGVGDKGMPPWKALLNQDQVVGVTAYVLSLVGTKPANPKAPQGELAK
jgi:cytochrome c oxidase cbb3-type subunit 3